ncbi:hypothetical protein DXG01_014780 [Tephrocybe rancida]|nr:hypothetical protein DXG01_014780 [Tephrocybe rancida]
MTVVMPAFRNLKTRRSSGRIWNKVPIAYDESGWEIPNPSEMTFTMSSHHDMSSPHSSATSPSIASVDSEFEDYRAPRKNKGKAKATHPSDPDYVPRPKNAFILFRSHFYQTLGGSDQNQISVAAGKAWKALPDIEKLPFQQLADQEKREHQEKFPNYTYAPGVKTGNAKRRNSAAKKKKTQPSTKMSLVPRPPRRHSRRPSKVKVEPASPIIPAPPAVSLPAPSPRSSILSEITESKPVLANDDTPSQDIFTADWSFPAEFVPTSEIPPLELSPVKPEQESSKVIYGPLKTSSLRPPSFEVTTEPFCLGSMPTPVENCLQPPLLPDLHYDYSTYYDLDQALDPTYSFNIDASPSTFDSWMLDAPSLGPLEVAYGGYPKSFQTVEDYDVLYFSGKNDEALEMHDTQDDNLASTLPASTTTTSPTSIFPPTSSNDCEMDQYVDYNAFGT